jgi:hypothetical protein
MAPAKSASIDILRCAPPVGAIAANRKKQRLQVSRSFAGSFKVVITLAYIEIDGFVKNLRRCGPGDVPCFRTNGGSRRRLSLFIGFKKCAQRPFGVRKELPHESLDRESLS